MTNEELTTGLRHIAHTMERNGHSYYQHIAENAIKALEQQPSEDTEVIKVSKGAVKARQGRFVIYDVDWLKEHFYSTEEKIYGQPKQPCEDCISRQAVINTIFYESDNSCDVVLSTDLMDRIKHLPSVKPKYTDEEIDKAQAVEQAYVDKMVELAVEETKRPNGKWIEIEIDAGEFIYKCSKCGMRVINPYKYCPMCGSYNGGGEDGDSN